MWGVFLIEHVGILYGNYFIEDKLVILISIFQFQVSKTKFGGPKSIPAYSEQ